MGVFLPLNSAWNSKPSLWCYNKLYEHIGCRVTYQDAESQHGNMQERSMNMNK